MSVLLDKLAAFLFEHHPVAAERLLAIVGDGLDVDTADGGTALDKQWEIVRPRLIRELGTASTTPAGDTSPGVTVETRRQQAVEGLLDDLDGFARREVLAASLTREERREILSGMVLTRAVDNQLKAFFLGGEVKYGNAGFQGKGFRSLGQEAIYAAAIRLKRGATFRNEDGTWSGDVVAPLRKRPRHGSSSR